MPAATVDHFVEQGATFRTVMRWSNADPNGGASTPIDLTGYVARSDIRVAQKGELVLSLTSAVNGGITLGGAAGTITILLTDEQTSLLTKKSAVYDLELESPSGEVYRVAQGRFNVSPNITQTAEDPAMEA